MSTLEDPALAQLAAADKFAREEAKRFSNGETTIEALRAARSAARAAYSAYSSARAAAYSGREAFDSIFEGRKSMKPQNLKHFTSTSLETFDEVASLALGVTTDPRDHPALKTLLNTARGNLFGEEIKRQERRALYETLKQEFEPSE